MSEHISTTSIWAKSAVRESKKVVNITATTAKGIRYTPIPSVLITINDATMKSTKNDVRNIILRIFSNILRLKYARNRNSAPISNDISAICPNIVYL